MVIFHFLPRRMQPTIFIHGVPKRTLPKRVCTIATASYTRSTRFSLLHVVPLAGINLAQRDMAMNQSCYALVARLPLSSTFFTSHLLKASTNFEVEQSGTVFDAIIRDTFKQIPFLMPSYILIQRFSNHVSSILAHIDILLHEIRVLSQARDLLLPRMMRGNGTLRHLFK